MITKILIYVFKICVHVCVENMCSGYDVGVCVQTIIYVLSICVHKIRNMIWMWSYFKIKTFIIILSK